MAFLDWIKRRGKAPEKVVPESRPARPVNFTLKGHPITEQWHSEWISGHDGLHGYRRHIGHSAEGFHGGLQVSDLAGVGGMIWSNGRPTSEAAEKVSRRLLDGYKHGFGPSDRTRKLSEEWRQDHQLARQRDETGKEPKSEPLSKDAPAKTVARKPLPKRERVKGHDIPF